MGECIQDGFHLFREPKIILIAEKHNLPGGAGKRRLKSTEDTLVLNIPQANKTRILQGRYFAACPVCGTVVDDNDLVVSGQLRKDGA
jgi:hypothetical protein